LLKTKARRKQIKKAYLKKRWKSKLGGGKPQKRKKVQ
jgi:hypothetical protein